MNEDTSVVVDYHGAIGREFIELLEQEIDTAGMNYHILCTREGAVFLDLQVPLVELGVMILEAVSIVANKSREVPSE